MHYYDNVLNFVKKNGYVPEIINPYHVREIKDICPSITAYVSSFSAIGGGNADSTFI